MQDASGDNDVLDGGGSGPGPEGSAPTPGWYPDPDAEGRKRWWTGTEWGPEGTDASGRRSFFSGVNPVPVVLFAVGFMLTVMAAVLLFTHVNNSDGRDCGAIIGAGPPPDTGDVRFRGYNAALCADAKQQREAVCLLMAIAGTGLIGASFLVDRRKDDDAASGAGAAAT